MAPAQVVVVGRAAGFCSSRQPTRAGVSDTARAVSARRTRVACSAAAAPPAPAAPGREAAGTTAGPAPGPPARPLASHPVHTDWLAHSRHVAGLELTAQDAVAAHLARLLGRGGRWAWQQADCWLQLEEEEEEAEQSGDEDEVHVHAAARDEAADQQQRQAVVASTRGTSQRGGWRQRCRGRLLRGAVAAGSPPEHWLSSALPPDLRACVASGALLSAEQEIQLAALVQQAKRAVQLRGVWPAAQLTQAAAAALAGGRADAELALVLRQGVAAQQLLVTANMRLVGLTLRRLQAGQQLGEPMLQDLVLAGRCALWRAAAGYSPDARAGCCRFSTYAVAAIRNAMRDVMSRRRGRVVSAPVRDQDPAQQALHAFEPPARQEAAQQLLRHSPRCPAARDSREQLAGRLAQQRLGAAARNQVLACAASIVTLPALPNGASAKNGRRPKACFDDAAAGADPVQQAARQAAVEEAVQLVLSCLQPSSRSAVLRLRFGLDWSDRAASSTSTSGRGEEGLVDFLTVGRQLGVSRQRACALHRMALEQAAEEAARLGLAS